MQFKPPTPCVGNSQGGKQIPIPHHVHKKLVMLPTTTIAGSSCSQIYLEDIMNKKGKKMKDQKGLLNCNGLFCPNIYLYDHYTVKGKMKPFNNNKGPYT